MYNDSEAYGSFWKPWATSLMGTHSPGSNYEVYLAFRKVGYACYGNMLGWSNVQKYLNFLIMTFSPIWGPIWGPSESLTPPSWRSKKPKKRVFSKFTSQNRDNNISMVCFEENKKGINFSDTYLGPEALRITRKCDFWRNFLKEYGFSCQNSVSGGPK